MKPIAAMAVPPAVLESIFSAAALSDLDRKVERRNLPIPSPDSNWRPVDAEILVTGWGTPPIDEAALTAMPRLRAIFHSAGSVRELIRPEVWAAGVRVVSAAEANNDAVAEYTVAQLVLALKGVHRAADIMKRTQRMPETGTAPGYFGQSIGMVSFGSVARKVRDRLRRLDAEVIVWDPYLGAEAAETAGVRLVQSLDELFAQSLAVSVHTPLIPGVTEHLIRREHLLALPSGGIFVNTARGAIVDEPALISVLQERPDLTAILDVTWPEPPVPGSLLYSLPNVHLTGHSAGTVGTEQLTMGVLIVDEVKRYLDGAPLLHEVTEQQARTRA